jgi:hypothetical protein
MKLFTVTYETLHMKHPSVPMIRILRENVVLAESPEKAVQKLMDRDPMVVRILQTIWQ